MGRSISPTQRALVIATPRLLRYASAFPDPPFEIDERGIVGGLDAELMQALCRLLGRSCQLINYAGDDFNGIFDGLRAGRYEAVISGTTITPGRRALALFSDPYLEFNQALIVNRARTPSITSVEALKGQTVGIQIGNTSDAVARRPLAEGAIGRIQYYPYTASRPHGMTSSTDALER